MASFLERMLQIERNRRDAESSATNINNLGINKTNNFTICADLDQKITRYDVLIADLTKKNVKGKAYGDLIKKYSSERLELQKQFTQKSCIDVIEFQKLEESADILDTQFSQAEIDILEKSRKEQNKLYFIGAGVLLLGAYIIIR